MALPGWVPDIETKPAPMPLLLVQSFVNTWEGDTGIDLLGDADSAESWLREAGLLEGPLGEVERVGAQRMREAVRALLVHNAGGRLPIPRTSRCCRRSRPGACCDPSWRPTARSSWRRRSGPTGRPVLRDFSS